VPAPESLMLAACAALKCIDIATGDLSPRASADTCPHLNEPRTHRAQQALQRMTRAGFRMQFDQLKPRKVVQSVGPGGVRRGKRGAALI